MNRKADILQALVERLKSERGSGRMTTARFANVAGISEAALYQYFPSKAHIFYNLITYIEKNLQSHINFIIQDEKDMFSRLRSMMILLLSFSEKNPGLTRIITGHALMFEHDALQIRVNQFFERIERQIRQIIRDGKIDEDNGFIGNECLLANQLLGFYEGTIARFVRSRFNYLPTTDFDRKWSLFVRQLD